MSLRIAFRHRHQSRGGAHFTFDIAIDTPTPGTTVLFGPSGAGKSTIGAVACGLLRPAWAMVAVDGAVLADTDAGIFLQPERRRIGMVFQDARLFPHLSVAGNLRYGMRRTTSGTIDWDEVIALLGIAPMLSRRPATLSGGERQRVAIGRALLSQPRLLVMDEPLAGLDAPRRGEILPYLARLSALGVPILYITHALDEVARLADTLVLVEAGRITAAGPLTQIAARADLAAARRDDAGAILSCRVTGHLPERRLTRLALLEGGADLLVPQLGLPIGGGLRVRVPAVEVILATAAPAGISVQNVLQAHVGALVPESSGATLVELRLEPLAGADRALPGAPLLARITTDAAIRLGLAPGAPVLALVKSVSVQILT